MAASAVPAADDDAETLLHRGRMELAGGHVDSASSLLRAALADAPDNPLIHVELGRVALCRRHPDSAALFFERADALLPNHGYGFYGRGLIERDAGRPGAARAMFSRATEANSDLLGAHVQQAVLTGPDPSTTASAVALLESVLRAAPSHPSANYELARILERVGDSDQAGAHYRAQLVANHRHTDALARYRGYVRSHPDHVDELTRLGAHFVDERHFRVARVLLFDAVKMPGSVGVDIMLAMAAAYLGDGQHPLAKQKYDAAMQFMPSDEREYYEDVRGIATGEELEALRRMPESERPDFLRTFWLERDPTPVTETNQRRLEHYRRVWYARRHFSEARTPYDDRGATYVRFGEPDERIGRPSGRGSVQQWAYAVAGGNKAFVNFFTRLGQRDWHIMGRLLPMPSLSDAARAQPLMVAASERRFPGQYVYDARRRPMDLYWSVTQSRGSGGLTQFDVYFGVRASTVQFHEQADGRYEAVVETGIVIRDSAWNVMGLSIDTGRIVSHTGTEAHRDSVFIGRHTADLVGEQDIVVGLQVRDTGSGRMQALRERLHVERFDSSNLAISDIVLSGRVVPADEDDDPRFVRNGLAMLPHPAQSFIPGRPLYVYFDIYNLTRGDEFGETMYEVEHEIERSDGAVDRSLIGRIKRLFVGGGGPRVGVGRIRQGLRSAEHETFVLDTSNLAPGAYVFKVTVKDMKGNRSAVRDRTIWIGS